VESRVVRADATPIRERPLAQLPRRRSGGDAIRAAHGPNHDRLVTVSANATTSSSLNHNTGF
jgi:hypothetical protein